MICKRCGTPLEEGQRFCTKCGTPVTAPAAEPVSAGPADTVLMPGVRGADPETGAVATPAAPATPPRKRRTGLWVGLAAAAVVVILLLDESIAPLDADTRARLTAWLRQVYLPGGGCLVLCSHDEADLAGLCGARLRLENGRPV